MARKQRTSTASFPQEGPAAIARVGMYARVSTLNGQDPEMQLRELRDYAFRRGWSVEKEYIDQGVSGSKESRPALNELMADAHRRRFDAVLVWKIDRFGRSLKHLVNSLAELAALGVAFVTALYDAMIACSNSLADSASPSDLRVMFILSDGDDNASRHNREQALQSLVKSGIRVYAIGERNAEDPWPAVAAKGIDALKRFAEKTGGKAYISKSGNDMQSAVTDISSQLSSVFSVSLGSTSPLPGDSVFKVEVKCRAKKVSLNAPQEFFVPLH